MRCSCCYTHTHPTNGYAYTSVHTGNIREEIVGTWQVGTTYLRFDEDGTLREARG